MTVRVLYLTGTRADFGLMVPTLQTLASAPGVSLSVCATGTHLSHRFGYTIKEVEAAGLQIAGRLPVDVDDDSPTAMARYAAQVMTGIIGVIESVQPHALLLLGDRPEMLAGALAGTLTGRAVVHVCGGERSGTVDDAIRHAISKLAHWHFVATESSRERLLRMGEEADRIQVVGAPGLDRLTSLATLARPAIVKMFGLDPQRRFAAFLFHPVVQDATVAGQHCRDALEAARSEGLQLVCLMPNADTGNASVRAELEAHAVTHSDCHLATHLVRDTYVSLLAVADLLIGNSSSGIVEAATFGTPVVNIGDRQSDRERNPNTFDANTNFESIRTAVRLAVAAPRGDGSNIYGDGRAHERIAAALTGLRVSPAFLKKRLTY